MAAVVDLLLQRGADPNVVDEDGHTPTSLLVKFEVNLRKIEKSPLQAGWNPNVKSRYGRTPFMGAVVRDLWEFANALCEDPNLDREAIDILGRTAMAEAILKKKPWSLLHLDEERFRSMVKVDGKELPADAKLVVFQGRDGGGLYDTPRGAKDTQTEITFDDPSQLGTRNVSIIMMDNSDILWYL